MYLKRLLEIPIRQALERGKSVLVLGPRQTGKTTLLGQFQADFSLSFVQPRIRQRYEKDPQVLEDEIEGQIQLKTPRKPLLVVLDEVQKVPQILDVVQDMIDQKKAQFILTGSSARKLKRTQQINLLPGRVVVLKMDPLVLQEFSRSPSLDSLLLFGSLPGIFITEKPQDKETDLESYVTTYLEEEIRMEAIVRNVALFARFLELAASESGGIINFTKLSQEIGVTQKTIASYYEILEDCMIAEKVQPLSESKTRKKLTKSSKYLFFDLGIRRLAAKEGFQLPRETMANLFEQFVGLELIRSARLSGRPIQIKFWRDPDGPEVDWILQENKQYVPIEVKWTDLPTHRDARHLETFLKEYPTARRAYLICQTPQPMKITDRILAIPWQQFDSLIFSKT